MIGILGGLGAAGAWALTTICYSRATRTLAPSSVLALVMLVGLVVTAPAAVIAGVPEELDGEAIVLLAIAGSANVGGLFLVMSALQIGKVGIVAPIVSTEGAVAAVLAVVGGETLAPGAGAMLVVIAVGIALASMSGADAPGAPGSPQATRAAVLALLAALTFGVSLYATGRVSDDLPLAWVLFPARLIGVVVVALPLLVRRRLVVERRALPFVVVAGVAEVVGFLFFALGARESIAISAVLASQFGVVAGVAAYFLFGERITRRQTAGIAAIAAGVAVLTWIQA
jgi:drug/metabolite transporter (DMT)-like permease